MKKRRISAKLLALFLSCSMLTMALVGCGGSSAEGESSIETTESGETSKKEYTHRIIVMSDPHYMTNESQATYNANHPGENAAPSAGNAFGYTQTEKMSAVLGDVTKFAEREKVEGVLVLGDLGTDDYGYRNLSENYVQKFKDEVMTNFPGVSYALPGNHDTYQTICGMTFSNMTDSIRLKLVTQHSLCLIHIRIFLQLMPVVPDTQGLMWIG